MLGRTALLVAVAVAFADSSIVVLAVPDLVGELDVDVADAAWVITAYNAAVVVAAAAVLAGRRRIRARPTAAGGLAAFALASLGCAAAPSYELLVGCRAVQGLAAALVAVAALPLLGGRGGIRLWTLAATVGLATGPALGGVLTELFSWRSIFVAQAPLVGLGLLALRPRALPPAPAAAPHARRGRPAWLADATLAAFSAALVGALFLVVVLLVNGFGHDPLPAAIVASALPAAALAAERLGETSTRVAVPAGGLLVAAGLTVLALLPGDRLVLVVLGLALAGGGLGLAAQPLGRLALDDDVPMRAAGWTVLARHVGLVAALLAITPVLVGSLDRFEADAEAVGGELVLRAPLPVTEKVPLLLDLVREARGAEARVPDVDAVLGQSDGGEGAAALADGLSDALAGLVAAAFRAAFLVCAAFGLLAALLALGLGRRGSARARPAVLALTGAALVAAAVGAAAGVRGGALDSRTEAVDACAAPPFAGRGVDAVVQRVALAALADAACSLGTSRPALLRELLDDGRPRFTRTQVSEALRGGLLEAIEAERERGTIGGATASLLRFAARNAPLDLVQRALEALGGR